MKRGAKPIPRNLRVIYGTQDRKDRGETPAKPIPEPEVSVPPPPDDLPADVQAIFTKRAVMLAKMRVMTESDVDLLALYAISFVESRKARKIVWEKGEYLLSTRTGNPYMNPYLPIARKAEATCMRIMLEFGLTPSSRNRISQ